MLDTLVSGGTNSVAKKVSPDFQPLENRDSCLYSNLSFACDIHYVFVMFADKLFERGMRPSCSVSIPCAERI